jgi:hypothetical protein
VTSEPLERYPVPFGAVRRIVNTTVRIGVKIR